MTFKVEVIWQKKEKEEGLKVAEEVLQIEGYNLMELLLIEVYQVPL